MHVLSEPTSSSSGAQMSGSPLNSGGLPTTMFGSSRCRKHPAPPGTPGGFGLVLKRFVGALCWFQGKPPRPRVAKGARATLHSFGDFLRTGPLNRSGSNKLLDRGQKPTLSAFSLITHVAYGLIATELGCPRHVRFPPDSDRTADIARARFGTQVERRTKSNEAPNPHMTAPEARRARMISEGRFSRSARAIAAP